MKEIIIEEILISGKELDDIKCQKLETILTSIKNNLIHSGNNNWFK